jgi:hypothetical protein
MDEFVFAVMKNSDNEFVVVTSMPDTFHERETPHTAGEVEYILNRIAFDMQGKRMIDEVAKRLSPEQESVAQRVQDALKRRKGS